MQIMQKYYSNHCETTHKKVIFRFMSCFGIKKCVFAKRLSLGFDIHFESVSVIIGTYTCFINGLQLHTLNIPSAYKILFRTMGEVFHVHHLLFTTVSTLQVRTMNGYGMTGRKELITNIYTSILHLYTFLHLCLYPPCPHASYNASPPSPTVPWTTASAGLGQR